MFGVTTQSFKYSVPSRCSFCLLSLPSIPFGSPSARILSTFFYLHNPSLAMFTVFLSLGLALLPSASAAVHDVQVGAAGQLQFSPEAIVSLARSALPLSMSSCTPISLRNRVIRLCSILRPRTTPPHNLPSPVPVDPRMVELTQDCKFLFIECFFDSRFFQYARCCQPDGQPPYLYNHRQ